MLKYLSALLTAVLIMTVCSCGSDDANNVSDIQECVPSSADFSLRDAAFLRGIDIGTAVQYPAIAEDSSYIETVKSQFSNLTPENEMKFSSLRPDGVLHG